MAEKAVLVVEDEPSNARLLALLVARCGFRVEVAHDGREALAMLRAQDFDLVLLDLLMPVMRGEELLGIMKTDARLRSVPVLIITTMGGSGDPDECPLPHIRKPFRTAEVQQAIAEVLG